jgi:hypothetical protein
MSFPYTRAHHPERMGPYSTRSIGSVCCDARDDGLDVGAASDRSPHTSAIKEDSRQLIFTSSCAVLKCVSGSPRRWTCRPERVFRWYDTGVRTAGNVRDGVGGRGDDDARDSERKGTVFVTGTSAWGRLACPRALDHVRLQSCRGTGAACFGRRQKDGDGAT